MTFTLYILIINCFVFLASDVQDKLIFVYTHFRHGARAPGTLDDENLDLLGEKWTNPSELTGIGQRMCYILGLRNRIRYIKDLKFLSEKFDPHELIIFSSNFNRTIESIYSQLQGLYPQSAELGEVLTPTQESLSYPQVNVHCDEIEKEIEKLGGSALPHKMTVAPVRMIDQFDLKINAIYTWTCDAQKERMKGRNRQTIQVIKTFVKEFNEKYGEQLNTFFGTTDEQYEFPNIEKICEAFVTSYVDRRNLTEFKKTGIDFEEFNELCNNMSKINFQYQFFGDKDKTLAHAESSRQMAEFIYYMKKRIDADISGEKIEEKTKDYSRPKMLIVSGHDSSITSL